MIGQKCNTLLHPPHSLSRATADFLEQVVNRFGIDCTMQHQRLDLAGGLELDGSNLPVEQVLSGGEPRLPESLCDIRNKIQN